MLQPLRCPHTIGKSLNQFTSLHLLRFVEGCIRPERQLLGLPERFKFRLVLVGRLSKRRGIKILLRILWGLFFEGIVLITTVHISRKQDKPRYMIASCLKLLFRCELFGMPAVFVSPDMLDITRVFRVAVYIVWE